MRSFKIERYMALVEEIIENMRGYWPLTLRQVYYQLVQAGTVANVRNEYQKLSRNLSDLRLEERVPWEAIEDRGRSMHTPSVYGDRRKFTEAWAKGVLTGYRRDLLQTQPVALELWTEKDALSTILTRAADPYCVPVVVARGFVSMTFKNELRDRARTSGAERPTRVLYFGDLDPSGWEMLPAMLRTLTEKMGLGDLVTGRRYALTSDQVDRYRLPVNPDALKDTDSRAKKYREQFGSLAVELDALRPDVLQDIVRRAIEENLDLSAFEVECQAEAEEREAIEGQQVRARKFIMSEVAA